MRFAGTEYRRPEAGPRAILAIAALCCASLAHAQASGSVGVLSDYRYRGYSLSDGKPAVQGSVGYDARSGAYAGLFASSVEDGAQLVPYLGYAKRDAQGRSWDIGVRWNAFTGDGAYDYAELHAGLAMRRVVLRVHWAPDYFGQVSNVYAEADGSVPLGERVRALWHVGASRSEAREYYEAMYDHEYGYTWYERRESDRTRVDLRAGFALDTPVCDVQLTWQHIDGNDMAGYAVPWDPRDRAGWVLGCVKRW